MEIDIKVLREVLGKDISEFSITGNTLNYVVSNYETEEDGELVYIDLGTNINIYELAHKCKEWARDNDFFLRSFYDYEGAFCYISAPEWVDKIDIPKTGFSSETEPESIIEACEYILQQNKKGI